MTKPALSERIKAGIQGIALGVAKFAGYNAAMPNKVQAPATRTGTNPNSSYAQQQRVRLSFEGENAIKNTSFARNYINKRRMYCSSGITYAPDTGDHALDEAVSAYCMEQWKHMGVGCSMQQAFARASDVNLPERGDSALQWYRDDGRLRLLEVTADRIGELYQFTQPVRDVRSGEVYFSGLYLQGPNTTAYRIYERGFDAVYTNPQRVEACDIIFFKDDITGGVRGVSIFASALEDVNSRYQILKSTKDTMQQQSKIAAIASNNSGQPNELDYETQVSSEGAVEYVETMADGAIVKYQFNGDNYQVLKGEHPSDSFINGMRYLDASASLAVGFPYEFLFSGAQSGGAPFRGAFEAAGREIMRLRNDVHRPRLDVISYVTIMDGVERRKLPPMPNIGRGCWGFTTLPTADAFRDDASDIKAIRSGITTKSAVIMANSGRSFPVVLRESMQEAVATAMAVEDANRALVKAGYKPSVTIADIAQVSDNPQQSAAAEDMTLSQKPSNQLPDNSEKARLSEMLSEYGECEGCEYCDDSIARMEDDSEKRFEKVVTDPETGRERTVRYGQAGKAADGGDRIRPGTAKGDSYCARSEKIKGDWRSDPNSPNNLSRKKWNCRGPKSLAKLAFDESKHPRADDGKFGSGGVGAKESAPGNDSAAKTGDLGAKEKEIANLLKERGHIVNDKGEVTHTIEQSGDASELNLSPEHEKAAKDATFTHNHPAGTALSAGDFFQAQRLDMKQMRAVTPDGVYVINRPKDGWPDIGKMVGAQQEASAEAVREAIGRGITDKKEGSKFVAQKTAEGMAQRLGIPYRVEGKPAEGQPAKPAAAALADFDESKHPRADDGKFGSGGGGEKSASDAPAKKEEEPKKAAPKPKESEVEDIPKETKKSLARRDDIVSRSKPAKQQEYFHGTSETNVESILKNGIKPTDNTMGFHAAFAGGEGLAMAYGAGSAAAAESDHIALIVLKGGKDSGLLNPPGADNIAYKPGTITPDQIDRIEIYHKDAGKNDKPVRVIRPK